MKSAEEFEGELYKLSYGAVACRINLIRARDREIVEACKDVCQEIRSAGVPVMWQAIATMDLVLRDLEGGK